MVEEKNKNIDGFVLYIPEVFCSRKSVIACELFQNCVSRKQKLFSKIVCLVTCVMIGLRASVCGVFLELYWFLLFSVC